VILDQGFQYAGIEISGKSDLIIKDFEIRNAKYAGIYTHSGDINQRIKIDNMIIKNIDNPSGGTNVGGIKFDNCSYCVVKNSTISNIKFAGNSNTNTAGIHSYLMDNVLIEGNTISDTDNGIFHKGSNGNSAGVFTNNYIFDVMTGMRI